MTEEAKFDGHPELLLTGSDRPRALPPQLRARLEEALAEVAARPLSPEVRDRLESTLSPAPGTANNDHGKWKVLAITLGAAAAIAVVAGVVVPGSIHRPGSNVAANNMHLYVVKPNASLDHGPSASGTAQSSKYLAPVKTARGRGPAGAPPEGRAGQGSRAKTGLTHTTKGVPAMQQPSPAGLSAQKWAPLQSISPESGPVSGGNRVTIEGPALYAVTKIFFGNTPASGVEHISRNEIRAVAPVHSAGTIYVTVEDKGGRHSLASVAARYTFAAPGQTLSPGSP